MAGETVDKIAFKSCVMASNPKATEAQVTLLWNNYQATGSLPKGFESLNPSKDNKSASKASVFGNGTSSISSSYPMMPMMTLERTAVQPQAKPEQTGSGQGGKTKITDEQSKDLTIGYLSSTVQDAIQTYMSQNEKDGIVSKGWDELKQIWKDKHSSTSVGKVIENEMAGVGYMQKAQNGELSKREYYQGNKERLLNMFPGFSSMTESQQLKLRARVDSLSMQQIKDMQHEFAMSAPEDKAKLKERTQKFINEPLPQRNNIEIKSKFIPKTSTPPNPMNSEEKISFEEVFKYERGCEYSKENVEKLQYDKAKFSFVSGAYQKVEGFKTSAKKVFQEYDAATLPRTTGEYTIPGVEPSAENYGTKVLDIFQGYYGKDSTQQHLQTLLDENKFDAKAIQDDKGNVSLQFGEKYKTDADKNAVLNSLLKVETTKQDTKLKQVLGGKNYEEYQTQYAQSYITAMGTKNSAELAKAFAEGQDGVNRTVSGVMTYGGMTLMVVGGVATLVPGAEPLGAGALKLGGDLAMAGMATKTVLDVANATTKKGGMTDDDAKSILKEAAINAGGLAIGFGAGTAGSKVASELVSNGVSRLPALVVERGVDATLSILGNMAMTGDMNLEGNAMNALIATVTGLSKSKSMFKGERAAAVEEGARFRENKFEQTGVLKDSPSETVNPFAKENTVPKAPVVEGKASTQVQIHLEQNTPSRQAELIAKASKVSLEIAKIDPVKYGATVTPEVKVQLEQNVAKLYAFTEEYAKPVQEDFKKIFGGIEGVETPQRVKASDGMIEKQYRKIASAQGSLADAVNQLKTETDPLKIAKLEKVKKESAEKISELTEGYGGVENVIRDALGQRIIFSNPSSKNIDKFVEKLIEGINNGELVVKKIERYGPDQNYYYLTDSQVSNISDACASKGIELKLEGGPKPSGYITTQMDIEYKNGVSAELQIRDKKINDYAEFEHGQYNKTQGKASHTSSTFEEMMNADYEKVMSDKDLRTSYNAYKVDYYKYKYDLGHGKAVKPPVLPPEIPKSLDQFEAEKGK